MLNTFAAFWFIIGAFVIWMVGFSRVPFGIKLLVFLGVPFIFNLLIR